MTQGAGVRGLGGVFPLAVSACHLKTLLRKSAQALCLSALSLRKQRASIFRNPLISVVIPAKDEAGNLPALLDEIDAALLGLAYEVLVVDDASEDDSWALLTRRGCPPASP